MSKACNLIWHSAPGTRRFVNVKTPKRFPLQCPRSYISDATFCSNVLRLDHGDELTDPKVYYITLCQQTIITKFRHFYFILLPIILLLQYFMDPLQWKSVAGVFSVADRAHQPEENLAVSLENHWRCWNNGGGGISKLAIKSWFTFYITLAPNFVRILHNHNIIHTSFALLCHTFLHTTQHHCMISRNHAMMLCCV